MSAKAFELPLLSNFAVNDFAPLVPKRAVVVTSAKCFPYRRAVGETEMFYAFLG